MVTTIPEPGTSRYPLTEEQADLLTWVRWAYAGMSVLAAACLVSALLAGHPGARALWTSVTGVLAFPVLTFLSIRQLRCHRAALGERGRRTRPPRPRLPA
ncbi:hypothetical protein [Streptomyces niveus]|uniref:DUF202 domain-containing protein n=1 Tax=Streptomyces niveus TaxID=193462 RepID=A0ABZ2AF55_STRNV|nr:hypothetical protein [Streptomyces niveus]